MLSVSEFKVEYGINVNIKCHQEKAKWKKNIHKHANTYISKKYSLAAHKN